MCGIQICAAWWCTHGETGVQSTVPYEEEGRTTTQRPEEFGDCYSLLQDRLESALLNSVIIIAPISESDIAICLS